MVFPSLLQWRGRATPSNFACRLSKNSSRYASSLKVECLRITSVSKIGLFYLTAYDNNRSFHLKMARPARTLVSLVLLDS
jgi:hypothetical protein